MSQPNGHTDKELDAFAAEQVAFIEKNREELLENIRKFHEAKCTAPVAIKEQCTFEFSFAFLELLDVILEEREQQVIKNGQ